MMRFKGTIVFGLLVVAICVFAILEFKKGGVEEETKATKDHIVLNYKPSDVTSISFKSNEQSYLLKRNDTEWSVVQPIADKADDQAIETTISEIFSQSVESLEVDDGEKFDLNQYGLTPSAAAYDFTFSDGKNLKIALGSVRTYDKGYYLHKNEDGLVLVGGAGWESLLQKKADSFRSKKINLIDGQLSQIRILSKFKGQPADIELQLIDGKWVSPKNKNIKIHDSLVSEYFNKLHLLRADNIASDTSDASALKNNKFINPELTIEVKIQPSAEQAEMFKLSFKQLNETDMLMISSVNQPIYKLSKSKVNDFVKGLDYFRDKKFPFVHDHTKAALVEIKKISDTEELKLKNSAGVWEKVNSPSDKINQAEVAKMLESLAKLEAREFLNDIKTLKEKSNNILVKDAGGNLVFSLAFAEDKKSQAYRVFTNLSSEAVLVSKSSIDNIMNAKIVESPASSIKVDKTK